MNLNDSIYREKYLKYKKKYLELKKLEENLDGGSFFKRLKKGAQSITGTTPQDKFNGKVIKVMEEQVSKENEKIKKWKKIIILIYI